MLEWLKAALGDAYTEEIDRKVSAEIGKGFVARADYNALNETKKALDTQLKQAQDEIGQLKSVDAEDLRKSVDEWKQKAEQAERDAGEKIAAMRFEAVLDGAIHEAKGRNARAIRALLDVDALRGGENPAEGVKAALESLKKDNGYLFEGAKQPPAVVRPAGRKPDEITRETFEKMRYSARLALKRENPELYESFTKE